MAKFYFGRLIFVNVQQMKCHLLGLESAVLFFLGAMLIKNLSQTIGTAACL
jgi:hypothetical protein